MAYRIIRDGFYFRAQSEGYMSPRFTSASQAGLLIERKAGADAHRDAAVAFLNNDWMK